MSSPAASAYSFRQLDGPPAGGGETLESTLAEAEAIREAARVEGLALGRSEAEAAVRAEAAEALGVLAASIEAVRTLGRELAGALETDAATIGLRLAEQIVAGAIDAQPERIVEVAGLALRRLVDRRSVILVVNPSELELVAGAAEQLRGDLGGIENLNVQADRRIARGGVVARTEEGEIDATVAAQLDRARELIAAELAAVTDEVAGSDDAVDDAGGAPDGDVIA